MTNKELLESKISIGLGRILIDLTDNDNNNIIIKKARNIALVKKTEKLMVLDVINDDWELLVELRTDSRTEPRFYERKYNIYDEEWGFVKWVELDGELNCSLLMTQRQFEKEREEGSWQHSGYEPIFFDNYHQAKEAYLEYCEGLG